MFFSVLSVSKVVGKLFISGRGVKNERKKIILVDFVEIRFVKYIYIIENEVDLKNSVEKFIDKFDDRSVKYIFIKEKIFIKDDDEERFLKYIYIIDKDFKIRFVIFKEDNKKNGKNIVLKFNVKIKSKLVFSISIEFFIVVVFVKVFNIID